MSTKPNQLLSVAKLAFDVGKKSLSDYSHPKSPRKFTQPQLLACLVLKAYLKTTYRGIIDVLAVSDKLVNALKLREIPDHRGGRQSLDRKRA